MFALDIRCQGIGSLLATGRGQEELQSTKIGAGRRESHLARQSDKNPQKKKQAVHWGSTVSGMLGDLTHCVEAVQRFKAWSPKWQVYPPEIENFSASLVPQFDLYRNTGKRVRCSFETFADRLPTVGVNSYHCWRLTDYFPHLPHTASIETSARNSSH